MKNLKKVLDLFLKNSISIIVILISTNVLSNQIKIEIKGNKYTDTDVILALIKNEPDEMQSRVTGVPFNSTAEFMQDEEDRELKGQMRGLGLK